MALFFLDTSAIVKRYVVEPGHLWVRGLCDPANANDLVLAETALIEVIATLCRKARETAINEAERDRLIGEFDIDVQSGYVLRVVTRDVYARAGTLCKGHALRAYDAIQLASALMIRDDAVASGAAGPTFVTADINLLAFALSEGLPVENPNNYP